MSFALDEETESLAAALSYLDDLTALEGSAAPLLLDVEPPTLDAAGWLGNAHEVEEEEEEEEDPTELLAALTNSSLLSGRSQSSSGQSSSEESQEIITVPRPPRRQQKPVQLVIPSAPKTMAKKKDGVKKPLNYNPNRARDERRQELIYLRKKVSEMEEELAMLQSNKQDNVMALSVGSKRSASASLMTAEPTHDRSTIVRSACTGNVRSSSSAHSFVPEVWKDMCARQLEQRVKAERENIRLKLILEGQIKIAKSMEKLLKKRETLRAMETCGSKRAKRVHLPPTNAQADAAIYDALLAGVEESYREVDAVFEANGLNHMETSHRDAKVRDGVNGMYLEVFANKVLPFDMRTTGAAVWQHFKGTEHNATRLARSYYSKSSENFTTMEDTMVERFGLEMHANNTQADFHVKQILRRYVEKDRVVIVWRSRIEPLEFSNTPLSGIHFEEKGYVVTKPPSTMSQDFTLLQTCYIITPDLSDKTLNEDAKAGALTEFVLSSTAANITASHEMIENVLLDQALHKRSHH